MDHTHGCGKMLLGWDRSLVEGVVRHLLERWPEMDFSKVTLVMAGGRAGRRVVALLADQAAARKRAMVPPKVITPGVLPEILYPAPANEAGTLARQLAWAGALAKCAEQTGRLFPRAAHSADGLSLLGPAKVLECCAEELASGVLDFADIAAMQPEDCPPDEAIRWQDAAVIHARYRQELAAAGLVDLQDARREAIEQNRLAAPGVIVLAGLAQLNRQLARMLMPLMDWLDVLIFAPAEMAEDFDELGSVRTAAWQKRQIDVEKAALCVVENATQQAREVFVRLAELPAGTRTDQVTIGVTDETLVPHIQAVADHLQDIRIRYGPGRAVSTTRPCQLLAAVGDFLESPTFDHFARLLKHPDVEQLLRDRLENESQIRLRDWRTLVDEHAGMYLPGALTPEQMQPTGWRGAPPDKPDRPDDRNDLAWLYRQVTGLLEGLMAEPARRAPGEWAGAIMEVLAGAYTSRPWNQNNPEHRLIVLACQAIRAALLELQRLGAATPLDAVQTLRAVLAEVEGSRIPPVERGDEVELVGWLELLADDANHLVLTGFNDGLVPQTTGGDPFLNNTLRRTLGLSCDEDRVARDAYMLAAILGSRPAGAVTLLCTRFGPEGDPLMPSRLLLACRPEPMARRITSLLHPPVKPRAALAWRYTVGAQSAFRARAFIPEKDQIQRVTSLRVTAFRDYINSPQGFYLRHVLGLETVDPQFPREMGPLQCGELVHAVLHGFGESEHCNSTSRQQCTDVILGKFEALAAERFGARPPGVLRLQLDLIAKRLARLAEWQANHAKDGWRIRHREWSPVSAASLAVDTDAMGLRGRVDRIDQYRETASWIILDYKLGKGKSPAETHLRGGQWIDLQLPLYRHLVREVVDNGTVRLGYVTLGEQDTDIGLKLAEWDTAMLAGADQIARRIVRDIWEKKFDEPGDHPPEDGAFAYIFGQNLIDESADSEEVPA